MRQVLTELGLSCSSPEQPQPHVCEEEEVYIGVEPRNYVAVTAPASQDNVAVSLFPIYYLKLTQTFAFIKIFWCVYASV